MNFATIQKKEANFTTKHKYRDEYLYLKTHISFIHAFIYSFIHSFKQPPIIVRNVLSCCKIDEENKCNLIFLY